MAERIYYEAKPTPIGPDARQELVDGIDRKGTLHAIQNLSILGMALSRIPSEPYRR